MISLLSSKGTVTAQKFEYTFGACSCSTFALIHTCIQTFEQYKKRSNIKTSNRNFMIDFLLKSILNKRKRVMYSILVDGKRTK